MKKRIVVLATIMVILMVNFSYAEGDVIFYNGDKQIDFEQETFVQNGEIMLPVRGLENLNTKVVWRGNEGIDIVKNYELVFVDDGVKRTIYDRGQNKIIQSEWQKNNDEGGEYYQKVNKIFDLESKKIKEVVSAKYEGEVVKGAFNLLYRRDGDKDVTIYIDKKEYVYKGEKQYLKTPPVLKDGVTYVPISLVKILFPNFNFKENDVKKK